LRVCLQQCEIHSRKIRSVRGMRCRRPRNSRPATKRFAER